MTFFAFHERLMFWSYIFIFYFLERKKQIAAQKMDKRDYGDERGNVSGHLRAVRHALLHGRLGHGVRISVVLQSPGQERRPVAGNRVGRVLGAVPSDERRVDSVRVRRGRVPVRRTVFPERGTSRVRVFLHQSQSAGRPADGHNTFERTDVLIVSSFPAGLRDRTVRLLLPHDRRRERRRRADGLRAHVLARDRTQRRRRRIVRLVRSRAERRRRGGGRPTRPRASFPSDAAVLFRVVRVGVLAAAAAVARPPRWRTGPPCPALRQRAGAARVRDGRHRRTAGPLQHRGASVPVGRQQALHVLRVAAGVRPGPTGVPAVPPGARVRVRPAPDGPGTGAVVVGRVPAGVLDGHRARPLSAAPVGTALFRRAVSRVQVARRPRRS